MQQVSESAARLNHAKACVVKRCEELSASGYYFCQIHWKKLPRDLQRNIRRQRRTELTPELVSALRTAIAYIEDDARLKRGAIEIKPWEQSVN